MNDSRTADWYTLNQRYLAAALSPVRWALQEYVQRFEGQPESEKLEIDGEEALAMIAAAMSTPPNLEILCKAFGLTLFERNMLLLCAGVELSASLMQLCAAAQGGSQFAYPTFSLALATLPNAHWSALTPASPLRFWRLIEVNNGASLTQSRLRIDERVLHYLNGISYLDERLYGLFKPVSQSFALPPSQQVLVEQIIRLWLPWNQNEQIWIVQLCGDTEESRVAIASAASAAMNQQLYRLQAADIPATITEREALARLWEREAVLNNSVLLLECDGLKESDRGILSFIEGVQSHLILSTRDPVPVNQIPGLLLEVPKSTTGEQLVFWQNTLGDLAPHFNGALEVLATQFSLSPPVVERVYQQSKIQQQNLGIDDLEDSSVMTNLLWDTCRLHSRPRLQDLARRIQSTATWDDLVLPDLQKQMLQEIAAQLRQRSKVYDTWEFTSRGTNGLGISVLFAGASGTGKTMAAEVLAQELRLDLYRIDLSQVVSKYIGETEKNLRRVFDAAETGGAVLLFDEADALFGKRSEVKDSHDRYANIEVSYLLQRMETYRGLAILTTNFKDAIDPAFMRRIRFVVQFPFPDVAQRLEIWQRIFPPKLPREGLNLYKLAQLNVAGGNIRNIALNAAFLAADAGESIQMKHLQSAAQSEYGKLGKTLTEAEVGGWM